MKTKRFVVGSTRYECAVPLAQVGKRHTAEEHNSIQARDNKPELGSKSQLVVVEPVE